MANSNNSMPAHSPQSFWASWRRAGSSLAVIFLASLAQIYASDPVSVGDLIIKGESAGAVFLRKIDLRALGQIQFGGRPRQLQARGSILYAGCAQGLKIVDFENPSEPKLLSTYNFSGGAVGLTIAGQRCYVAETSGTISALDISDPMNPSLIWRNNSEGENFGLAVVGAYAFLAKGAGGIEICDVSGAAGSTLIKRFAIAGEALDIIVSGGFAYVACGTAGFKIFDLRDPENLREIGGLALAGVCSRIALFDQTAVLSAGEGGMHLVDTTVPSNPILKKSLGQNTVGASLDLIPPLASGPKVILDCDPGNDADDIGDLAVLHQLANDGELQILGTMYSMRPEFGAPIIEILNRAYGRPELPVGVSKTSVWDAWDRYGSHLWTNFYNSVGSSRFAPNAVQWYRKTLAAAEDKSVSIVLAGQLRNMSDLWRTPADVDSPLTGSQLMIQKIKRLIVVAGIFPEGFEFNMFVDPTAAQVANEWNGTDLPVTFVGIEIGNHVVIGGTVTNKPFNDPVRAGYAAFYEAWQVNIRPAWAGLGLLFAARGYAHDGVPLFHSVKGSIKVFADGRNEWTDQATSNVEYLRKEQADSYYASILDSLLMRSPVDGGKLRIYSLDDSEKLSVWNITDSSAPMLIGEYEPPRLTCSRVAGSIQILWKSQFGEYSLWSAPALAGPWQLVSGPFESIGDQKRYSVPSESERYFQLRR